MKAIPYVLISLALCQTLAFGAPCECARESTLTFVNPETRGVTFLVTVVVPDPPSGAVLSARVLDEDSGEWWTAGGQWPVANVPVAFSIDVRCETVRETHLRAVVTDDRGMRYVSRSEPLSVLPDNPCRLHACSPHVSR
jgi:hypothetical protein